MSVAGSVEVEVKPELETVASRLQRLADYAHELETLHPTWSDNQILDAVHESIDRDVFGDLGALIRHPHRVTAGRPANHPHQRFQSPGGYPGYFVSSSPPVNPLPRMCAEFVNPATLTVQFPSFTAELNSSDSPQATIDSDSTYPEVEFESGPHFAYVSFPRLTN
jgi:hypothetical protein